uniref:MADF domain-containing protein n=1 Tax=Syphacia muris TaxID=451379 RepID=A0A0N5AP17_9BILA
MAMFGMSDDMKAHLIQAINKRPLIWKVSDPKYTDVPSRWLAFEEIAQELSDAYMTFSSDMIKIAWKNMMDYYNQIRRRHDRAMIAGTPFSKPKWQFYEMMHFVRQDKPAVKRKYNWIEPSKICNLGGIPASKLMGKDYDSLLNNRSLTYSKETGESSQNAISYSNSEVTALGESPQPKNIRQSESLNKSHSAESNECEIISKTDIDCKPTPRREGLRQAPRKSLWLVKKEYVTDEIKDWDEPPKKTYKRSPVSASSKLQRGKTHFHSNDVSNMPLMTKTNSPSVEILSPIDANATESLSNVDSAIVFGRQLVARLNALPVTHYRAACKEIEKVVTKFEGLSNKAKARKVTD